MRRHHFILALAIAGMALAAPLTVAAQALPDEVRAAGVTVVAWNTVQTRWRQVSRAMVDSPEFKQKIILIRKQAGEARQAALRMMDDPKIKAEIAEARRVAAESGDRARQIRIEMPRMEGDPKGMHKVVIVRTDGPDDPSAEQVVRETADTAEHDAGRSEPK